MNADTILLELVEACVGLLKVAPTNYDRERATRALEDARLFRADAQKAPQPRTASEQPVVACVIDLDGHDYLCWKAVAAETYSDKPQRDLIYATPQPESLVPINCNRQSERPCPECHIQPGETCDICGAAEPAPAPADEPPPLPEPFAARFDWGDDWSQWHDKDELPPPKWDDEPPSSTTYVYTADQMRARDDYWIAKLQAERSKPI
jgi:hypothetical protein